MKNEKTKLVIVESPGKLQTIQRYLGDGYTVMASKGHVRDLATSGKGGLGVDIDNNFEPTYIIDKDKRTIVKDLKNACKNASEVILATDPDREGEAIAWHLAKVLDLDPLKATRIVFHEITRESISNAIANPTHIDLSLVESQETRRIVDRILGFKLSSLLFKKIHSRSAGRVQSATLKMIYDHEKEIEEFVSEEYWNILSKTSIAEKNYDISFVGKNGKALKIKNKNEADEILNNVSDTLEIKTIKKEMKTRESKEPFTTSTLQQEAYNRLKFNTDKTQKTAQKLYEGIEVNGEHVGLITYMRTDSTRLSPSYVKKASDFIVEKFGKEYLGSMKKVKKTENMQDAHEAIRPTSNHRTPESVRQYLTADQYALYKLIYCRALASLMKGKVSENFIAVLDSNGYQFKLELSRPIFKGYEILYSDEEEKISFAEQFPELKEGNVLPFIEKKGEQKFTQPPAHYSEAAIVKLMEKEGIGRPSTYATTIKTLYSKNRQYVNDKAGVITITEQGKKTAYVLNKYFPDVVNVEYTAKMENKLDNIQSGLGTRNEILSDFYSTFMETFEKVSEIMYADDDEETGEICPECGAPLIKKMSKNGKEFIGCKNFPNCRYIKNEKTLPEETGEICPECGSPLVIRYDKKNKPFVACSSYPKCKYIKNSKPLPVETGKLCPECGKPLVKKKGRYGYFIGCSGYPECNYMEKLFKKYRKKNIA